MSYPAEWCLHELLPPNCLDWVPLDRNDFQHIIAAYNNLDGMVNPAVYEDWMSTFREQFDGRFPAVTSAPGADGQPPVS